MAMAEALSPEFLERCLKSKWMRMSEDEAQNVSFPQWCEATMAFQGSPRRCGSDGGHCF
jgi:hypothetical protein